MKGRLHFTGSKTVLPRCTSVDRKETELDVRYLVQKWRTVMTSNA